MAPGGVSEYDSDDLYDEYEEEGYDQAEEEGQGQLSPEDQVAMAEGTTNVRTELGDDATKVTDKQIQDALWHYYYDVDKSVSYLRNKFIAPPPPTPPKPTSKKATDGTYDALSFSALRTTDRKEIGANREDKAAHGLYSPPQAWKLKPTPPIISQAKTPLSLDFSDMPWMKVPKDRLAKFVAPPRMRGGLLGGAEVAPKRSKLQALAAARKKKNEEKKEQEQVVQEVGKLSMSEEPPRDKKLPLLSNLAKRQKVSEQPITEPALRPQAIPEPREDRKEPRSVASESPEDLEEAPLSEEMGLKTVLVAQTSSPSAFAQTLFGFAPNPSTQRKSTFAMPHSTASDFDAFAFSKPSPDDIVLAAQSQAGKKTPATTGTPKKARQENRNGKETDLSTSVSKLKVVDVPPPKSKGLNVIEAFENSKSKRNTSFVVVGHVDAGKSTLMGRLLVSLKYVEERTVEKFRKMAETTGKQSFALAWIMDQRSEERDRGVTIDIATNHFETDLTKFTILDAPGHRDFVPNMIAGASQADFGVLVIDANTGAYEKGLKGQTKEHVLLLRSLGVQRLVIAVNKLDMVDWLEERFNEIHQQILAFLTGLGFQSKFINFIPISGLNGDNITEKIASPAASWYTGDTLVEALEAAVPEASKALQKPFRMSISEVFRSQQGTTTLGGRIDSGTIQIGDVLVVQPSGETAYVKNLMVDKDSQEWAVAGQNISMALTDIDPIHIRVGDILCSATDQIICADTFTMKALAFEHLMPMPVDVHRGRLHAPGRLYSINATLDKNTGEVIKKRPKIVQPGGVARVSIKLDTKVPLEAGQRVVIRTGGETIAAGLMEESNYRDR